jgi:hypothetical protein
MLDMFKRLCAEKKRMKMKVEKFSKKKIIHNIPSLHESNEKNYL